jgi:hypothetical protein
MLAIERPGLPGGRLEVWYLEAFCRSRSTRRDWSKTVIPHVTEKVEASADGKLLRLRSRVEGGVEVDHEIRAGTDEVDFRLTAVNRGPEPVDLAWAQPCLRVGRFSGRTQETYLDRCFIFLDGKLTTLDRARRTEEALYRGGQVYLPPGIDPEDVNPRPLSPDTPSVNVIGCLSADGKEMVANIWEPCQELFQGVINCIHSDLRLGRLAPGESRSARGKIYLLPNDPARLLERCRRDFPEAAARRS